MTNSGNKKNFDTFTFFRKIKEQMLYIKHYSKPEPIILTGSLIRL